MPLITIFYEDSRNSRNGFGMHALVVQCVADRLQKNYWDFKNQIIPHPTNGVSNLLRELQRNMEKLAGGNDKVFALIDRDEIHNQLKPKLPYTACKTSIVARIKECPSSGQLKVILLDRNLESLLNCLREIEPSLSENWALAIEKKDLNSRDAILGRVARPPATALRRELLNRFDSFDYLIKNITAIFE